MILNGDHFKDGGAICLSSRWTKKRLTSVMAVQEMNPFANLSQNFSALLLQDSQPAQYLLER